MDRKFPPTFKMTNYHQKKDSILPHPKHIQSTKLKLPWSLEDYIITKGITQNHNSNN